MEQSGFHISKNGIDGQGLGKAKTVHWNLRPAEIYEMALARGEGEIAGNGPLLVKTGQHTGRSAQDKFIVRDAFTEDCVWWDNNKSMTPAHFDTLLEDMLAHAEGKELLVQDLFGGADPTHRLATRVVTELAWHSLFIQNLLIEPVPEELDVFDPEFVIMNFPSFKADPDRHGSRTETVIAVNFERKMVLIAGTSYAGETKKSVFSMLNFTLPAKRVMPMHCSVNVSKDGDAAVFFGLSGTGKTTLSADPNRILVGDDEHGWSENGVFNFEGGCYAKTINLSPEHEPDIYQAIRRDALLENVAVDETGRIDYSDSSRTENTRVSYPIYHIQNIVKPASVGGHAKQVIFLTADAFGVLPPVSKLTDEQTKYHFLSGFTAKLAGTERGVTEPTPTFSSCFGAAFLSLHPSRYAEVLVERMQAAGSRAYLVNTGWNGTGKRISIGATRHIINAILNGSIDEADTEQLPYFDLAVPLSVAGVDAALLDPRKSFDEPAEWDSKARNLATLFIRNFEKFTDDPSAAPLVAAGPQV